MVNVYRNIKIYIPILPPNKYYGLGILNNAFIEIKKNNKDILVKLILNNTFMRVQIDICRENLKCLMTKNVVRIWNFRRN